MIARLISWLVDLLVLFFLIRLISRLFSSSPRKTAPRSQPRTPERLGGTLVRDPHCGTYVPESRAIRSGSGASTLFFCSTACRDAYAASHPAARRASGA